MTFLTGAYRFDAAGRNYTLQYDFNALAAFEDLTGKPAITAIVAAETGDMIFARDLRALCWAGLQRFHPQLDLERAGLILTEKPDCVRLALSAAIPDPPKAGLAKKLIAALKSLWRRCCKTTCVPVFRSRRSAR